MKVEKDGFDGSATRRMIWMAVVRLFRYIEMFTL